jgi:hypothetical protein
VWDDNARAKAAIARHAKYNDPDFISKDVRIRTDKVTALLLRLAAIAAGTSEQDFIKHLLAEHLTRNFEDGPKTT